MQTNLEKESRDNSTVSEMIAPMVFVAGLFALIAVLSQIT